MQLALNASQPPLELMTLLLHREPAGGAEPLIRENLKELLDQALSRINRALSAQSGSTRAQLDALVAELRARKAQAEAARRRHDERYTRIQERLHRWQEHTGRRSSSITADLLRVLFGGQERLSLPEAVSLWNDRERQWLQVAAATAALDGHIQLLDMLAGVQAQLDSYLALAREAVGQLRPRVDALRGGADVYAPWSVTLSHELIERALLAEIDLDGLVGELVRRQASTDGADALLDHARSLARSESERRLAQLSLTDLIEIEARTTGLPAEGDLLLTVGQQLLERLRLPVWQLTPGARPRVETLQVTPEGRPIFSLDGLGTAAYGDGHDRLGFVRVYLDLARDELALVRDGDESFQAVLLRRNLYVLEELAAEPLAADDASGAARAAPDDAPRGNGTTAEAILPGTVS
jgi:hypothetical protein